MVDNILKNFMRYFAVNILPFSLKRKQKMKSMAFQIVMTGFLMSCQECNILKYHFTNKVCNCDSESRAYKIICFRSTVGRGEVKHCKGWNTIIEYCEN